MSYVSFYGCKHAVHAWVNMAQHLKVSHEKKNGVPYFPLNPGCLTGILILADYNTYICGLSN